MKNISRLLSMIGISIVIAYICVYFVGFNDFDDSKMGIYFQGDDFAIYFRTIMIHIGLSFSISLIEILWLRKKSDVFAHVVAVVCSIASIVLLLRVISKAQDARMYTIFAEDKICEFHCNVVIIMSYVVITLLSVYFVLLMYNVLYRFKIQDELCAKPIHKKARKSYIHVWVVASLSGLIVGCNYYNNRINRSSTYEIIDIVQDSILDFVIIGLPATLILGTIVKEWIQNNKYLKSIGAYIAYMYIAYCMIFRLYNGKLDMQIDAFNYVNYLPVVISVYMLSAVIALVYIAFKLIINNKNVI